MPRIITRLVNALTLNGVKYYRIDDRFERRDLLYFTSEVVRSEIIDPPA
jgi:hypothetical protein